MTHVYTLFFILFWLSPTIIAFLRGHKNLIPIALLNVFLSFTLIGYFVSLIWCFSDNTKQKKIKLKDWQILLIFGILVAIVLTIVTKSISTHSSNIIDFVKIYTFDFNKLIA